MNKKVQIVEDEAIAAMILKINLDDWGYESLEPVGTGSEAIELAKNEKPDVILMDVNIIGPIDGIETAESILSFSDPKIIFLTGYDDKAIHDRANTLNPLAFITKPYDANDLKVILDGL